MARLTGTFSPDAGSIQDQHWDSSTPLDNDNQEHLHKPGTNFALAIGATPVAREEIVFVAKGAAVLRGFHALCNVTGSTSNVDFDIKKNGTTMLSSTVNVINSDADRLVKDGTLSVTAIAADDVISMELTTTTTTGMQGPFCWAEIDEAAG